MLQGANKVKLGRLLVEATVVSSIDLTEAIQVSKRLGVPIGQVLMVSGCVSEAQLEAALLGQSLISHGTESVENIIKALKAVKTEGISLYKALGTKFHELDSPRGREILSQLLIEAEVVTQHQIDHALTMSFEAGIPLGRALVMEGILPPSLFPSVVNIYNELQSENISQQTAIDQLQSVVVHWFKAEESMSAKGDLETQEFDIDEIKAKYQAAKDTSEEDETESESDFDAKSEEESSLEEFIEDANDTEVEDEDEDKDEARALEEQVRARSKSKKKHFKKTTLPKSEIDLSEVDIDSADISNESFAARRLVDMLQDSGYFSETDIERACELLFSDPFATCKFLLEFNLVSKNMVNYFLTQYYMYSSGILSYEEASGVLRRKRAKSMPAYKSSVLERYLENRSKMKKDTATKLTSEIDISKLGQ